MDTNVQVAVVSGGCLVFAAFIAALPTLIQSSRLKRIESHTEKTGNGFAGHVLESLEEIKAAQANQSGQFAEHVRQSDADKQAAHREALSMWNAIRAVANANPPQETDHDQAV